MDDLTHRFYVYFPEAVATVDVMIDSRHSVQSINRVLERVMNEKAMADPLVSCKEHLNPLNYVVEAYHRLEAEAGRDMRKIYD